MPRQQHFEQVAIEAVGRTAHALQLNVGRQIEVICDRPRLQIEIDQTYRWRWPLAAAQQKRAGYGKRRISHATHGRIEGKAFGLLLVTIGRPWIEGSLTSL